MKNRIFIYLIPILLVACGCHGSAADSSGDAQSGPVSVQLAPVVAKDIRDLILVPGSVAPSQGSVARLAAPSAGRISKVFVKEGAQVKAGDIVAELDASVSTANEASAAAAARAAAAGAAQSTLAAKSAAIAQAQAVATAKAGIAEVDAQNQADLSVAEGNLGTAKAEIDKIKAGPRPEELAQAKASVTQASAEKTRTALELKRTEALEKDDFASKRDLETAKAVAVAAEAALSTAEANLQIVEKGPRSEDKIAAQNRYSQALRQLQATKRLCAQRAAVAQLTYQQAVASQLDVQAKQQEASAAQENMAQKQADSNAAGASAALLQIRAPFSGRVSKRFLNPGDVADTTTPIIEIAKNSGVEFIGSLPSDQSAQLSPGMPADIHTQTGKASGVVTNVSVPDSATGMAVVRISCDGNLPSGETGQAEVTVRTDHAVAAIPSLAVVEQDGKQIAFVADGDTAKQVDVKVGPTDGDFVEILSGVKPGQNVVILGQHELADGAKIVQAEASPPDSGGGAGGDKGSKDSGA